MKKMILMTLMLVMCIGVASAQDKAEIKFNETIHDFGTFSEDNPIVGHIFEFKNIGKAPLVIHQTIASCGCTVAEYSKEPVLPGKTGQIKVVYNGKGKYPGSFKKSITIRTNGKTEMVRIFIKGDMKASEQ